MEKTRYVTDRIERIAYHAAEYNAGTAARKQMLEFLDEEIGRLERAGMAESDIEELYIEASTAYTERRAQVVEDIIPPGKRLRWRDIRTLKDWEGAQKPGTRRV